MATRGSTFPLIDRLLDGKFATLLRRWSIKEGLSNPEIVHRLRENHDITVSAETIRRWLADLGIERRAS